MAQPHWLTRTKTAMQDAGNGALWLPLALQPGAITCPTCMTLREP